MKTTFAALAALALISGSAMADAADATRNCVTNWVGGACGPVKSDASHSGDFFNTIPLREKECDHDENETPAKGV